MIYTGYISLRYGTNQANTKNWTAHELIVNTLLIEVHKSENKKQMINFNLPHSEQDH